MDFFVNSIIVFIIAIFPILLSTFYIIYTRSLEKEEKFLCIDIAIIFTQYILMLSKPKQTLLIASIPLLISLLEKRKIASVTTTFILLYLSHEQYNINLLFLIFEYLLILSIPYIHKKINKYQISAIYTIIKLITFLFLTSNDKIGNLNIFNKYQIIMISITFIIATTVFTIFYDKCKGATKLFMTIKELEEDKQIKQTLFTISHEIKNPLAVCKGYLDMYDYNNPIHTQKYVPIIKSEIEKTLILLQDFLCLTKTNLKKEILDINCLIDDCLDNLELLLTSNNIKIKKELIDDEIYVNGDYNRLYQVFVNVIKNAVEAMEDDEKVLTISEYILKNKIVIKIKDTGNGIDKEILKKIGEPFYTSKKNGTGLGISFSIEIVNALGGNLEFLSEDVKGTTVQITLPLES